MVFSTRNIAALTLLAALGSAASLVHAQPASQQIEQARVVSSTRLADGSYNVTYEYAGHRYTTRTDTAPGRTMPIQISAMGVTTSPVLSSQIDPAESGDRGANLGNPGNWQNVAPEPGVVVSGNGPAPVYQTGYPPPVYVQPGYAAPVYVQPGYAYPQPYYASPIGLSLNLGYSRGWGGGGWHRGGWR
ncbi:MAG: hypothetical protein JWQ73_3448 [Variovorax sp.]|nr:hypothetical protein [Variovorax sp.]